MKAGEVMVMTVHYVVGMTMFFCSADRPMVRL